MVVFFYKQLVKAAENEESIFRRADDGFFEQVVLHFSHAFILIDKSILKYRRYLINGRPSKIYGTLARWKDVFCTYSINGLKLGIWKSASVVIK